MKAIVIWKAETVWNGWRRKRRESGFIGLYRPVKKPGETYEETEENEKRQRNEKAASENEPAAEENCRKPKSKSGEKAKYGKASAA